MEIGKISITLEIDGVPCAVPLKDLNDSRKNLLLQMILGFNGDATLKVVKLKNYTFEVISKEDYN